MKEYLYVISCVSLPHIVKIGFSTNCKRRMDELSNTSTPFPFKLKKQWEVKNARILEKEIHRQLHFCRINSQREFFGLSPSIAIGIIEDILKMGYFEREKIDENLSYRLTNSESIGKIIRQTRLKQGLTQKQLSLVTGTGLRVIGEIENGKNTAQIGIIFKLLDILKIKMFGLPPSKDQL